MIDFARSGALNNVTQVPSSRSSPAANHLRAILALLTVHLPGFLTQVPYGSEPLARVLSRLLT